MKNELTFLYPPIADVRFSGGVLDIRGLCFPLEVLKEFDFLFSRFSVSGRGRGVQVVFQERPSRPPRRGPVKPSARRDGPATEGYTIECDPKRIVLSAAAPRGRFFALATLLQAVAFHAAAGRMPCFMLRDAPQISFRGFMLATEPNPAPLASDLQRLLLELALLKFTHFFLSRTTVAAADMPGLVGLAQRTGTEIIRLDGPSGSVAVPGLEPDGGGVPLDDWLAFFLERCRQARARGRRAVAWSDNFLIRPEWIRKVPRDILLLNRAPGLAGAAGVRAAVGLLQQHQVPQALCVELAGGDRLLPDARAGAERVAAACAAAGGGKLAGVMLSCGATAEGWVLPEGLAMLLFQSASLLWSSRLPGPESFSRWALGRDEPDLFRLYSFLAQAEHRLPFTHLRYLFEDPLLAPCLRQGDPREVEAHFRKAALYLKKREIAGSELAGFFAFAQRLYEFIATKAEFSVRLQALLATSAGGDAISALAARFELGSAELQELYRQVRGRYFSAAMTPAIEAGFAGLRQSLRRLARAAPVSSARSELLEELQGALTGDPPAGVLPAGREPVTRSR